MNTGKTFIGRPALGAWSVYGLGTENQSLPGYVVMLDKRGGPIGGQPNWSSGFMPSTYSGTLFRPSGDPILDLRGPDHITPRVQREQLDLLAKLNQGHLDARPGGVELASRINSYELAYRMQSEAPEAVDIASETQPTLDIHATILHLMGLDHEALTYFHQGRKESLTDVGGRVIRDVIATSVESDAETVSLPAC